MHSTTLLLTLVTLLGVSSLPIPRQSANIPEESHSNPSVSAHPPTHLYARTTSAATQANKSPSVSHLTSPQQLHDILAALTKDNSTILGKLKAEITAGASSHVLPYGRNGKTMLAKMDDGVASLTVDGKLVASTDKLGSAGDFFKALEKDLIATNYTFLAF
jgi:hypothetical protein